ncbi:hypothetical protein GCM10009534_73580 [Kribbella sandramycini]
MLRMPPYCASITSTTFPGRSSNLRTAASAARFTSGAISPAPGAHGRTVGSAGADGVPGVALRGPVDAGPGLRVAGGTVPVDVGEPLGDGVPVDGEPLQPTNRPAPAISSPRRPNSPEETMSAVSPGHPNGYCVTR